MQRLDLNAADEAQALEAIEAEVWLDWLHAVPPALADSYGIMSLRIGGAVAGIARGTDVLMYNRVVGLGMAAPARHGDIAPLMAAYARARVQRWMVQWCPAAVPASTVDLLYACGFYHHNNWAKLVRSTAAPVPAVRTDLRVECIGSERRDAFATILEAAFQHDRQLAEWNAALIGRPGWRAYMAFAGTEAVATGALFVQDDTAWIGFGATHPRHRGRGAQSALVAARIEAARELGCARVVVETAQDLPSKPCQSYRNLRRLGFDLAYIRANYVMVAETAVAGLEADIQHSAR